jgi:hypothetical protein
MSLAHAEVNTTRLLERVIDAVPDFYLIEIEGDAAFIARRADTSDGDATVAQTLKAAMPMHRAFHLERQYVAKNLCPCKRCSQANDLKLKFVAHIGEVATQTIRRRRKLVRINVIHFHRLLKNRIEVPEYVLYSRPENPPEPSWYTGSVRRAVVQDPLEQVLISPSTRNPQIVRGGSVPLEPAPPQNHLGRHVVHYGAGLYPVQS